MKRLYRCLSLALLGWMVVAAGASELEHEASRDLVRFVTRAAELVSERGAAACEAFSQRGSQWLAGDRYVFVLDLTGMALCHASQPILEGRDLSEVRDPDGKPIMKLIQRQIERGDDGWVHYLWPRPDDSVLTWKSTYLRRATAPDGGALVVGAGAYNLELEKAFVVDRVNEAVELLERDGEATFDLLRDKAGGFVFYDVYVFVMSAQGVMLVNSPRPDLEGSPVLEIEDQDGVRPGRAMLDLLATETEGWVSYFWPRPGDLRPSRKEAFIRKATVGGEEVVVGAGIYHAD